MPKLGKKMRRYLSEMQVRKGKATYGHYWQKMNIEDYDDMFEHRPELHENFINFLQSKKDVKTVLEVGCGKGIYPIKLKNLFSNIEYEGIVFGKPAIEYCKKNSKFNFIQGDFITMELDKKHDLVFSHAVIDHVYDIKGFLNKIVLACKKYAYVSCYRGYFPNLQKHSIEWNNKKGCYYNDLAVDEIKRNLLQCGLDDNEFVIIEQKAKNSGNNIKSETIIEINKKL